MGIKSGQRGNSLFITLLVIALGLGLGIGGYTFLYAKGLSYMSTDPEVCANCHIMQPQYDSWQKSSHHAVFDEAWYLHPARPPAA